MSRRQDYIVRIRYQNELPPPEGAPKMLNIPVSQNQLTNVAINTLSNMARKQPTLVNIDSDLGMPLDLTEIRGVFEQDDESGLLPAESAFELDPKDQALLKDISFVNKSQPGVVFLRRTEYISSEVKRLGKKSEHCPKLPQIDDEELDPEAQLRAVERTFEAASSDISTLKHPRNPALKAVASYPLLPDSQTLDLTYLIIRMVGSAVGVPSLPNGDPDPRMQVSLFRPMTLETDEWMSLFLPDTETALAFQNKLTQTPEVDPSDDTIYRYIHTRDYDMDLQMHDARFEELAINMDLDLKSGGMAYYTPIAGRTNLKRRRVLKFLRSQMRQHNLAAIDLTLRDPSTEEMILRDNARAEYDPISYTVMELPNDEDEDIADS